MSTVTRCGLCSYATLQDCDSSALPTDQEVMAEVTRILGDPTLSHLRLYRIFYYTADPLAGTTTHPMDGSTIDFAKSKTFSQNRQLIDKIENLPDVAVRRGTLAHQGWELGHAATRALMKGTKNAIVAKDILPKIQQKGVDMRIGLDIATLALKRLVSTIVIVAGDADFVPALKLARTDGVRVYLDTLGHPSVRQNSRFTLIACFRPAANAGE